MVKPEPDAGLSMQLRDHIGNQPAPACLVRGAQPASGIAVEVFVEQDVILEMRVRLHLLITAKDGTSSGLIPPENIDQAVAQLVRDLPQRQHLPALYGAFHAIILAEEFAELAQAIDIEIVDRHPDRPAPIGISAEKIAVRFGR